MSETGEANTVPLPRFFGYPKAKEGPNVPYQKAKDENPVLRGIPLVIGAWLFVLLSHLTEPCSQHLEFQNSNSSRGHSTPTPDSLVFGN